jgi:hypothetical protein
MEYAPDTPECQGSSDEPAQRQVSYEDRLAKELTIGLPSIWRETNAKKRNFRFTLLEGLGVSFL